ITKGISGEELAPIGSLKQAEVVAITDDGHCVQNNELMRRALEYARMFDLPVMDHCQHLSSAGSVELLRAARQRGVSISGEACPHHFTLTDSAIAGSDAFWRED